VGYKHLEFDRDSIFLVTGEQALLDLTFVKLFWIWVIK